MVNYRQDPASGITTIPPGTEAFRLESVVRKYIINQWELQDQPDHLQTIRDRILRNDQHAGRLLGLDQQILKEVEVPLDNSREQIKLGGVGRALVRCSFQPTRSPPD